MDERFFATAAVALILALFFGGGWRQAGKVDPAPSHSAQAAPVLTPPPEAAASAPLNAAAPAARSRPSAAILPAAAPIIPVVATPKT
jgi:hypothetical protein